MSLHSVSFFIMFCSPDSYFVPWICFHSLLHLKFLYLGTTLIWSGKAYEKQFMLKVHKWTPRIDRHSQKVIVSMANRYCIILTFLKWTLSQAGTSSDCKNVQLQDSCLTVPHNILRFFFTCYDIYSIHCLLLILFRHQSHSHKWQINFTPLLIPKKLY